MTYEYACSHKDKCGKVIKEKPITGYHAEKVWQFIKSGTDRWVTTKITSWQDPSIPPPSPDDYNGGGGGPPPFYAPPPWITGLAL